MVLDLESAPRVGHVAMGKSLKHVKEQFLLQAWEQYVLPGTDTVKAHTSVFRSYFPGAAHAVIARSSNKYRPVPTTERVERGTDSTLSFLGRAVRGKQRHVFSASDDPKRPV